MDKSSTNNNSAAKKPRATAGKSGKAGGQAAKKSRTLQQMLEDGKYTTRILQKRLRMGSRTVKAAVENPSLLSLGDVYRLADLMGEDVHGVLRELLDEIDQLPDETHPVNPR